jgi:hypothetical protein
MWDSNGSQASNLPTQHVRLDPDQAPPDSSHATGAKATGSVPARPIEDSSVGDGSKSVEYRGSKTGVSPPWSRAEPSVMTSAHCGVFGLVAYHMDSLRDVGSMLTCCRWAGMCRGGALRASGAASRNRKRVGTLVSVRWDSYRTHYPVQGG